MARSRLQRVPQRVRVACTRALTQADACLLAPLPRVLARRNDEVIAMCSKMEAAGSSCDQIAEALARGAVQAGSTDDVTVLVLRLA